MAETHTMRVLLDDSERNEIFEGWNVEAEALAKNCESAKMPNLDHLKLRDYDVVYEPSDDTYLMLDGLFLELSNNNDGDMKSSQGTQHKIQTTLEIGCGTGVGTIYAAQQIISQRHTGNPTNNESEKPRFIVTDINPEAIRVTMETARANNIPSDLMMPHLCDLATPLLSELQGSIDLLIFNPPYVPTPDDEVGSQGIEASWAGGKDGRIVLDRSFPQIKQLLSYPHGIALIIVVDDNKPQNIATILRDQHSLHVKPLVRRRAHNEFLTLLKITHV